MKYPFINVIIIRHRNIKIISRLLLNREKNEFRDGILNLHFFPTISTLFFKKITFLY